MPGNRVAEDCDGRPEPFARFATVALLSTRTRERATEVVGLVLVDLDGRERVRLTCRATAAASRRGARTAGAKAESLILDRQVRGQRLRPGARLTVRITRADGVRKLVTFTMRKGKAPRSKTRCKAPPRRPGGGMLRRSALLLAGVFAALGAAAQPAAAANTVALQDGVMTVSVPSQALIGAAESAGNVTVGIGSGGGGATFESAQAPCSLSPDSAEARCPAAQTTAVAVSSGPGERSAARGGLADPADPLGRRRRRRHRERLPVRPREQLARA